MENQHSATTENPDSLVANKQRTTQFLFLLGAFVIGASFRLIRLGVLSLTNLEAGFALQALAVARGEHTLFGDQIAYVGLTGVNFFLFSASNFAARFWPAFSGSLVVFIPYLFRKVIGKWPAVVGSIVLAFSPDMVGPSRIIGSPMVAMVFLMLALGLVLRKKPILSGVCLGLGLMSGPSFWVGAVILGISFGISGLLFGLQETFASHINSIKIPFWKKLGISFGITLLVVGTGFFMAPAGLSGVFSGLYHFLIGFGSQRLISFGMIPFALIAYAAGAVLFGLWGGVRGFIVRNKLEMFLSTWALLALVFIILYPGSSPADIVWITLPLWFLSVRVVYFAWRKPTTSKLVVAITAAFVVLLSAFMLLGLRTLITPVLTQSQQVSYLIAFVGGAILLVAVVLLVNYGWSEIIARTGLLIGLVLVITASMISISVNATGLGPDVPYELWNAGEDVLMTDWLELTIDRALVWNARRREPVDINVSGITAPGMQWALRHYEHTEFVPFLAPQLQPGLLITELGTFPEISNSYQGQGLVWMREVPWQDLTPNQYLTWLITRDVPTIPGQVIFWVRTDLMPSGQFIE